MRLPRYNEYKKTDTSWLGEIPAHWGIKRLKWFIQRNDGGVWGEDPDGENDTLVLRSTEQSVDGYWRLDEPARRKLTESEKNSALLELGDLLVTKSSGSSLHIGKTTLVDEKVAQLSCCYSNFMQRIRLKNEFLPKLAWYAMNNEVARLQFDLLSNSTTGLANLNGSMISEILLPIPSREEQESIIIFLDRETAKIDALIAEQEKLLALLAEKRQATISHAVTKGLNPDAPMKDSGVEWLGEVPAHWELTPLARISLERCDGPFGSGIKSEHYTDEGALVVRLQNIRAGLFCKGEPVFLDGHYFLEKLRGHEVREGDLLVAGLGDDNNLLGRACVAPVLGMALVKADCFRFRLDIKRAVPEFVAWQLSAGASYDAGILATGTTRSRIPLSIMSSRKVVLPSVEEQEVIAAFVDRENTKIDSLKVESERAIALLKERRAALISAAVTGQIDVRNAVAEEKTASDDR